MARQAAIDVAVEEIGRISSSLQRPLPPNWQQQLNLLAPWFNNYLEYQIPLHNNTISVVTMGKGRPFAADVLNALQQCAAQSPVEHFRQMSAQFPDATWGCKLTLGDPPTVAVYLKKPLPLPVAIGWLRQQQVTDAALAALLSCADSLGKAHTHFLGCDYSQADSVPLQIYFTQWLEPGNDKLEQLAKAAATVGLDAAIEQVHQQLGKSQTTIWVSFSVQNGELQPTMKVDYADVMLDKLDGAAEQLVVDDAARQKMAIIREALRVNSADYLGVRWTRAQRPKVGGYFTRR